jgi:hypothetical protein
MKQFKATLSTFSPIDLPSESLLVPGHCYTQAYIQRHSQCRIQK